MPFSFSFFNHFLCQEHKGVLQREHWGLVLQLTF